MQVNRLDVVGAVIVRAVYGNRLLSCNSDAQSYGLIFFGLSKLTDKSGCASVGKNILSETLWAFPFLEICRRSWD